MHGGVDSAPMNKKLFALIFVVVGMLAVPATGQASSTFGSLLKNAPANGLNPCVETAPGPCTLVGYINPNDAGDPVTSPAPYDGVVVKVRIRSAAAESVTFRFATIDAPQGEVANAQITASGPTVTLQGTGEIEEYPARVPVKKGVHVALDAPTASAVYNQGGDKFTYLYAPQLVPGQGPKASTGEPTGQLLVQAVIEPDADKDGYGDETQDGCPANPQRTAAPCVDTSKPKLRSLTLGKSKFSRSTVLHYRLSEAAKVTIHLEKRTHGRKPHWVELHGKLTDQGTVGANRITIRRRFAGHKLAPGPYRLELVAADGAGNKSVQKHIGFRIKA
jgi:hypothetical protein